jgi:glucose/arabinose dehydrogenase
VNRSLQRRTRARFLVAAAAIVCVVLAVVAVGRVERLRLGLRPISTRIELLRLGLRVSTVASGLDIPWALAFVPDGRLFFTQRDSGQIRMIAGGVLQPSPVITLPVCCASGEGGLLGLAADPDFAANGFLYAFYTHTEFGAPVNRIERLRVSGGTAVRDRVLLDRIPGSLDRHNGGRLKTGPDGMLYAGTGDSNDQALPQRPGSLAGKILRMTRTGEVPADNPFPGSFVYTLGHRNAQGLAWDGSGALYATEHGPRSNDEVNRIVPGENYGWPVVVGRDEGPDYVDPIFLFFPETCAPSGAAFVTGPMFPDWRGDLLFTCLRGVRLHRLRLARPGSDVVVQSQALLAGAYGRLRDVVVGPDGALYVSTSNGGGTDRILRIAR